MKRKLRCGALFCLPDAEYRGRRRRRYPARTADFPLWWGWQVRRALRTPSIQAAVDAAMVKRARTNASTLLAMPGDHQGTVYVPRRAGV